MKKSDLTYWLVVIFFTIAFLEFVFSNMDALIPLWFAFTGVGILVFVFRIARGDD